MSSKIGSTKPLKMWIDGKCFDIRKFQNYTNKLDKHKNMSISETSTTQHQFLINKSSNGKLETSFRLPAMYYIRLNNFSHFDIKQLSLNTKTEIKVPQNGEEGYLTITGSNESEIVYARDIIQSVTCEIREKQRALQFISIPVNCDEVKANFETFKESVLTISENPIEGMDISIFQSPEKLHLTIAVLALHDFEKKEGIAALESCKTEVIEPFLLKSGPLEITVAGIDCMNGYFKKVNILYANAKVENENGENILQELVNRISTFFYNRGLIRQYEANVKLHVTLINTKYRKMSEEQCSNSKRSKWSFKKHPFDATQIMNKFEDYYFGKVTVNAIHLSYMSSIGDDGFYKPLFVIKF